MSAALVIAAVIVVWAVLVCLVVMLLHEGRKRRPDPWHTRSRVPHAAVVAPALGWTSGDLTVLLLAGMAAVALYPLSLMWDRILGAAADALERKAHR